MLQLEGGRLKVEATLKFRAFPSPHLRRHSHSPIIKLGVFSGFARTFSIQGLVTTFLPKMLVMLDYAYPLYIWNECIQ